MLSVPDERGAILAIVALLLVAIFGMVALVVDVGALLVMQRRVVAAADSASLAAAQSCAREEGDVESVANSYATGNAGEASLSSFQPIGCDVPASTGTVAVTYRAPQELYFAPILGFRDRLPVEASATALWGPAHKAEPIPVTLNLDEPRNCSDPCAFWLDPSVSDDDFSAGDAGLVDLIRWDGSRCRRSVSSSQLESWISGATKEMVSLPATPCALTQADSNGLLDALVGQVGQDKVFPVADGFDGRGGRFSVPGFTPLRIEDALPGDSEEAAGVTYGTGQCEPFQANFVPGENSIPAFEADVCLLNEPADRIIDVDVSMGRRCCSEPEDYEWVPDADDPFKVIWKREEPAEVTVEMEWERDARPGACGSRNLDHNAVCLLLSWWGPRVGGFEPVEDGVDDYGVRAVRLSD